MERSEMGWDRHLEIWVFFAVFLAVGIFMAGYGWHYFQAKAEITLLRSEKGELTQERNYLECQKETLFDKIGWLESDRTLLFAELTPAQRKALRRKLERR